MEDLDYVDYNLKDEDLYLLKSANSILSRISNIMEGVLHGKWITKSYSKYSGKDKIACKIVFETESIKYYSKMSITKTIDVKDYSNYSIAFGERRRINIPVIAYLGASEQIKGKSYYWTIRSYSDQFECAVPIDPTDKMCEGICFHMPVSCNFLADSIEIDDNELHVMSDQLPRFGKDPYIELLDVWIRPLNDILSGDTSMKLISIQDYTNNPISIGDLFSIFPELKESQSFKDSDPNTIVEHIEVVESKSGPILYVDIDDKKDRTTPDNRGNVSLGRFLNSIKTVHGNGTYINTDNESFPSAYRSRCVRASHLYSLAGLYSDQLILDRIIERINLSNICDDKGDMLIIEVVLKNKEEE